MSIHKLACGTMLYGALLLSMASAEKKDHNDVFVPSEAGEAHIAQEVSS